VVKGRTCQAYPSVRPQLESAAATWDAPSAGLDSACTDGNLVTAPAWPANPAWMRQFLRILGTPVGI
jgi:protease I